MPGKDRILELRDLLNRANRAYYVDATPIMSDVQFDRLLAELARLEAEHPDLADEHSPTRRVGGELVGGYQTVRHAVPMMSIDNSYDLASLREWHARVRKGLGAEGQLFAGESVVLVADAKIDGLAISLRYEGGLLRHAVTRGDGRSGDDVTHNVRAIRAIPLRIDFDGVLEVRGEVYLPLKEFARVNAQREAAGEEVFANPRNAAAGTLKQLDPMVTAERRLGFAAHGRGEVSAGFAEAHGEFLRKAAALGVPVSSPLARSADLAEIEGAIAAFDARRASMPFAVDGAVVRVDSFAQQERLGVTSKSPRWIVAYKYPAERKTTVLLRVDPQVGKTGKITPRATMEGVWLGGTKVEHATLHNYGRVADAPVEPDNPSSARTDIRVGDTVYVEKAGEVIPYVAGVVLAKRPRGAAKIRPPARCPECGGAVEVEPPEAAGAPALETSRVCVNPECPAQVRERLIWFAGRKQMDIEGLGEKTIDQVRGTDGAIPLDSFADVFRLAGHRAALMELERMGEKKVDNLLQGIEQAKGRGLSRVLAGMGIRHVGDSTARSLGRVFPDLAALLAAPEPLLRPKSLSKEEARAAGLPEDPKRRPETGLGVDTAPVVHAYLHSKSARRTFKELAELGVDLTSHEYVKDGAPAGGAGGAGGGAFAGRTVVITGTLGSFEREALARILGGLGAKVSGSVSSRTSLLVVGEGAGSKLDKARELNVPIMEEPELLRVLGRAGITPGA